MHQEYKEEIDIYKMASELIIDEVVAPHNLRSVLIERFAYYETKKITNFSRKHPVYPV